MADIFEQRAAERNIFEQRAAERDAAMRERIQQAASSAVTKTLAGEPMPVGPTWNIRETDAGPAVIQPGTPAPGPERLGIARDVATSGLELPRNLEIGFLQTGESVLRSAQRRGAGSTSPLMVLRERFAPNFVKKLTPWFDLIAMKVDPKVRQVAEGMAENVAATRGRAEKKLTPVTLGSAPVTRLTRSVQQNLPQYGAMVAASVVSGSTAAGLMIGSELSGGQAFAEQLSVDPKNPAKAQLIGDLNGLAESAGEMLVLPKVLKGITGGRAVPIREAINIVLENATQEGATGFAQTFVQTTGRETSRGKPLKDALMTALVEAIKAVPENAFVGGAMAGTAIGPRTIVQTIQESGKKRDIATLDRMSQYQAEDGTQLQPPSVDQPVEPLPEQTYAPEEAEQGAQEQPPTEPEPTAAEPQAPTDRPMSAKNADVEAVRSMVGLPPIEPGGKESFDQWFNEAVSEGIPQRALSLAKEAIENPRAMSPKETVGLGIAHKQIADNWSQLDRQYQKLDPKSAEAQSLMQAMVDHKDTLDIIGRAIEVTGKPEARAMTARKLAVESLRDDTNIPSVIRRATVQKQAPLSTEETKTLETDVREFRDANDKLQPKLKKQARRTVGRQVFAPSRRYQNMSEVDKNAELDQLLSGTPSDMDIRKAVQNLASRPDVRNLEDVVTRLQQYLPDATLETVSDAVVRASSRSRVGTNNLQIKLREILGQSRRNSTRRTKIQDLQHYLDTGTLPESSEPGPDTDLLANHILQQIIGDMNQQLRNSRPAIKERLQKQIQYLNAVLANDTLQPQEKAPKPVRDKEIERLAYQADRLRQKVRRRLSAIRPEPRTWQGKMLGPLRVVPETLRAVQAWRASGDASALARQAGIALRSRPIRTLSALPTALRALIDPQEAYRVNQQITDGGDSWWYHRAGLKFSSSTGPIDSREELFASRLAESIPVLGRIVRASDRSFVTLLNMVRADSFDAMTRGFTKDNGTLQEAQAIAAYVNVMTGKSETGLIQKYAPFLNGVLWAPQFTMSRFEYIAGLPLLKAPTWRTRRIILGEYLRYAIGAAVTMWLYGLMFGGKTGKSGLSTDFGKIVIGNTRLDPLSGLSQATVYAGRMLRGKKQTGSGEVQAIRGEDRPYGGDTMWSITGRFLRGKLGVVASVPLDYLVGEDVVGNEFTWGKAATNAIVPLGYDDAVKLLNEHGIPKGLALEMLSLLGEGVQVHDQESASSAGSTQERGMF